MSLWRSRPWGHRIVACGGVRGDCHAVAVCREHRCVRLAPRRRLASSGPLQVSGEVLEALLSADADVRRSAAALVDRDAEPALTHLVKTLVSGSWQVWTAQATWPGPNGRAVHVVDTGAGACLVEATMTRSCCGRRTPRGCGGF